MMTWHLWQSIVSSTPDFHWWLIFAVSVLVAATYYQFNWSLMSTTLSRLWYAIDLFMISQSLSQSFCSRRLTYWSQRLFDHVNFDMGNYLIVHSFDCHNGLIAPFHHEPWQGEVPFRRQSRPKLQMQLKYLGYCWPTIVYDCMEFVKRCQVCQYYGKFLREPPEPLHATIHLWLSIA